MKHPEEKEKIIIIAGVLLEPCSPIFKIHVKLENVKDKGFIYREHEFYELSSKYDE